MTTIFVYEYLSGPAGQGGPESLHQEGWAMLAAVLEDLGHCNELQVSTLLGNHPLPPYWQPAKNLQIVRAEPQQEQSTFRRLAGSHEYSWIIAPEFDDLLYQRSLWALEEGSVLLSPSPSAIRLTADKLELFHQFSQQGVPTPFTEPWPPCSVAYPLVCKPRNGAGSQATYLIRNDLEKSMAEERAVVEGWSGPLIAQQYVEGMAVSVAFLIGPHRTVALPTARQLISTDGRFRYLGGRLPLTAELDHGARTLAARALSQIEGLHGYIGVDLILGVTDFVIEINPRLTTSYVGLRRLTRSNLALMLLQIVKGDPVPEPSWQPGVIEFTSDGRIVYN